MASQTIESYRAGADVVRGDAAACKKASADLLAELGRPKGLFPLDDTEEFGYNRAAGYMWLVQEGRTQVDVADVQEDQADGRGESIGDSLAISETVSYAGEVTAFVEKGRLKKIAEVKTRELMLWLSVVEVYVDESAPGKVTFKTGNASSCLIPSMQTPLSSSSEMELKA